MKRAKNLIEKIADPDNLRLAFWKARKGKTHSEQVEAYRNKLDTNLLALRNQILCGEVAVGDYHYFTIYDPKERQICASAFPERVLHHALMNICHSYFDDYQLFDSYASRPGKGVHASLERAKKFTRSYKWFLKLDVRKYFASISHEVLKAQLAKRFKDYKLLSIFEQIIDSYEAAAGRGLPIGNLGSQYFANHYLTGLDRFIKNQLGCKAYVRYMDDMVLWHGDKAFLKHARQKIEEYTLRELKGELKPALLNTVTQGLPFCGYLIRPEYVRLSQRSKKRYLKKMKYLNEMYESGAWSEAACQNRVLPLIAFTRHAEARHFRKKSAGKY
ncbi:MAG: RNA-directed DNA polymerase [Nitrospinales bacterium]|jgi:RNA-directed DNA polymerase